MESKPAVKKPSAKQPRYASNTKHIERNPEHTDFPQTVCFDCMEHVTQYSKPSYLSEPNNFHELGFAFILESEDGFTLWIMTRASKFNPLDANDLLWLRSISNSDFSAAFAQSLILNRPLNYRFVRLIEQPKMAPNFKLLPGSGPIDWQMVYSDMPIPKLIRGVGISEIDHEMVTVIHISYCYHIHQTDTYRFPLQSISASRARLVDKYQTFSPQIPHTHKVEIQTSFAHYLSDWNDELSGPWKYGKREIQHNREYLSVSRKLLRPDYEGSTNLVWSDCSICATKMIGIRREHICGACANDATIRRKNSRLFELN